MADAPATLEGWYALHDFRRIDRERWTALPGRDRKATADEFEAYCNSFTGLGAGSSAAYRVVGHKADLLLIHLRPTVDELADAESAFDSLLLAGFTTRPYSYLSVTELSLYEASARGGSEDPDELRKGEFVQRRLYPRIPDHPYVSFYPMNKRRGESENWYTEEMEERRRMMRAHGAVGRKYTDRITQMITGSYGMDDWEWGVTLFAREPLDIKKLVQEMRFDEVSARFAEFGPFYFGIRLKAGSPVMLL